MLLKKSPSYLGEGDNNTFLLRAPIWPAAALFELTDWSVFEAAATDLDELTDTVTSYISFCEDMHVPTRTYLTFNNDKHWFSTKLKQLHQAK